MQKWNLVGVCGKRGPKGAAGTDENRVPKMWYLCVLVEGLWIGINSREQGREIEEKKQRRQSSRSPNIIWLSLKVCVLLLWTNYLGTRQFAKWFYKNLMGEVSIFPDEEKKFKSQNWYDAKLRQGIGKLQSSGQKWSTVWFFFIESFIGTQPFPSL